jgi:DNA-binding NarL/FixJ family response regulator
MENKIRVLIVDDRDVIIDGLKLIFSGAKDIDIKGVASNGEEAIELVRKHDYDVVLMDVNMPVMNGVEATKAIKKLNFKIKILANSFYLDPILIKDMMKAGAQGFVRKGDTKTAYFDAVKTVSNGGVYLSEEVPSKTYDKVSKYLKSSF